MSDEHAHNYFERWADWAREHDLAIFAIVTFITLCAMWSAASLRIDADLAALLPADHARMEQLEVLQRELGLSSSVILTLDGAPKQELIQIGEDVVSALEARDEVSRVEWRHPIEFWERNALYYAELDDLDELVTRAERVRKHELRRRNPLFISLDDKPAPNLDASGVLGAPEQEASLRAIFDQPHYFDDDAGALVMLVYPSDANADLKRQRALLEVVEETTEDTLRATPMVRTRLGGGAAKGRAQQDRIQQDLGIVSLAGLVLVALYLLIYFRRPSALGLLLAPLIMGLVWTMGFAAAWFGTLSVLTSFVCVILLGLGIDHGIHLLTRYRAERAHREMEDALRATFASSAESVSVAALTTFMGFLLLGASDFRAFHEFGLIAAFGMASVLATNLLLLPGMLARLDRWGRWDKPRAVMPPLARFYDLIARAPRSVAAVGLLLITVSSPWAADVKFQYSWRELGGDLEAFQLDDHLERALGRTLSSVYFIADDSDDRDALHTKLDEMKGAGELPRIARINSPAALVPPDQHEKQQRAEALRDATRGVDLARLSDNSDPLPARLLARLRDSTPPPFGLDDLPPQLRQGLRDEPGGLHERLLILWANTDLDDGREAIALSRKLDGLTGVSGKRYESVGLSLIAVDVIGAVQREALPMASFVLFGILIMLVLLTRRLTPALLCVGAAVTTLLLAASVMGLWGIELNYFNMVLVAVTAGMAVDGAVHLVWLDHNEANLEQVTEISRANIGALLTTALGFGSMALAEHPGVTSIAHVALIGLGASIMVDAVLLPALILIKHQRGRHAR